MRKPVRQAAALAALLAFGTIAPRAALAQPDEPRASPSAQQPAQPPPGYYAPPPGYQQPPPGGYYVPPPGGYYGQPYHPLQYRTRYEERRMMGLAIAGIAIFGGMWLMSGWGYYAGNGTAYGFIPVAGPLFYIKSENPQAYDNSSIRLDNSVAVLLTVIQAAGVAMGILGLVLTHKVAIKEPIATITPTLFQNGGGLAAVGRW